MTSQTTGTTIANRIREAINEGRWPSGFALRQEDLAEEFRVSRIPIRDALALLQNEGLVVIEPNRGAYLSTFTADEIVEIFDLRVLLEANVLEIALPLHTKKSLGQIVALQRQLDLEEDKIDWIAGDRAFHDSLYRPAGRNRALAMIHALRGPIERFSLRRLSPGTRRAAWSKEHQSIIDAVARRNVGFAITALTKHLRNTQKAVLASLSDGD